MTSAKLILSVAALSVSAASSAAPFDRWFEHKTSDGPVRRIHGVGDEYGARFEDEEGFSAWLYRIACNTLIDHQRKQMARGETIGIDKAHDVAGVSRSDDSFEYQELYQAIDGLTMSERTAVLLFYVEDRPIKEIATIMNVAEGTVKGYLSRGREHLRTKLSK